MTDYYDIDGNPMTLQEWCTRYEHPEQKRVALTMIGDVKVSTVWLGLDHRWGEGPPLIFETMIFGGPFDESQWRYTTKAAAEAGHQAIVAAVESGADLNGFEVPE